MPSSGRPSCETTLVISGRARCARSQGAPSFTWGQPRITARIRPTYFEDCSSEIDVGSVARIQKFPSSSLGMNSRPMNAPPIRLAPTIAAPIATAVFLRRSEKSNSGR